METRPDGEIKISANVDADLMCEIGALLYEETVASDKNAKKLLGPLIKQLRDTKVDAATRFSWATTPEVREYFHFNPLKKLVSKSDSYPVRSDRDRALVGAWYEFFPRSEGGNFKNAQKRLAGVKDMGFDVLYLPPVHPIGVQFRKGPNNTLTPRLCELHL